MLRYHLTHSIVLDDSSSFTPWMEPRLNMLNHWELSRPSTSSSSRSFGSMMVQHYFFCFWCCTSHLCGSEFFWELKARWCALNCVCCPCSPRFQNVGHCLRRPNLSVHTPTDVLTTPSTNFSTNGTGYPPRSASYNFDSTSDLSRCV